MLDKRALIEQEGWQLISNKYENLDSELEFICPKGHKVFSSWRKMRDERFCPICNQEHLKLNNLKIPKKEKNKVRILALDQSTHITGWCLMDGQTCVSFGSFRTEEGDEVQRFNEVKMRLVSMINNYQPDIIGMEGTQYQQNIGVTTFQTLCRLQGVLMECCYEFKIPFEICHTATWRTHCGVTGQSRTDKKRSMQLKIKDWFDLDVTDDEADAVGIAKFIADKYKPKMEIIEWE